MLKLTIPALAVGAMSGAAAAEAARAAGAPTVDAAVLLPPVEVVASPLTTPLVIVTDPKTPRQPLPASDGADYLKTIPGFTSIRSGGTNGDPRAARDVRFAAEHSCERDADTRCVSEPDGCADLVYRAGKL